MSSSNAGGLLQEAGRAPGAVRACAAEGRQHPGGRVRRRRREEQGPSEGHREGDQHHEEEGFPGGEEGDERGD